MASQTRGSYEGEEEESWRRAGRRREGEEEEEEEEEMEEKDEDDDHDDVCVGHCRRIKSNKGRMVRDVSEYNMRMTLI